MSDLLKRLRAKWDDAHNSESGEFLTPTEQDDLLDMAELLAQENSESHVRDLVAEIKFLKQWLVDEGVDSWGINYALQDLYASRLFEGSDDE